MKDDIKMSLLLRYPNMSYQKIGNIVGCSRQRITREHSLYRDPSRSAVITQAIIEFLDRHEKPKKVETG